MTSSLFIYFPQLPDSLADTPSEKITCLCLRTDPEQQIETSAAGSPESTKQDPQWSTCNLSELSTDNSEQEVYVFLPNLHILSTQVQAPKKQHKHLAQILPFLCEDKLACDLEDVHIAAGSIRGEDIAVRIIEKELLDDLLIKLKVQGISPEGVYSDAEPLMALTQASNPSTPLLWMDPERGLLIRQQQVLSLQAAQAVQLASSLKEQQDEALLLYRTAEFDTAEINLLLEELRSQNCVIHETALSSLAKTALSSPTTKTLSTGNDGDNTALLPICSQQGIAITPQTCSNLLTGAYSPPRKTSHNIRWQPLALVASLLIGLNLVYLLASGVYFNIRAQKLETASEQLYREYFPQDRRIINIRTQTKAHLDRGQQQSGDDFLNLLGQLLPSWEQHKSTLRLKSMRYNSQRKEILLDIESKTISQLDSLQQALGPRAELLSANEDSKQGVRGRIKFRGGI
ncbi:type II secretion system protein GspL [Pseudomaricurvus sp.]|uniref:type II secretion system protein GspL n=1 Tax=Pseudomaricurvus sp. TaxID=2004510 RepID=UPI003F6C087A